MGSGWGGSQAAAGASRALRLWRIEGGGQEGAAFASQQPLAFTHLVPFTQRSTNTNPPSVAHPAAAGALLNSIDTGSQVCSLQWNRHEREILSSHGFRWVGVRVVLSWVVPAGGRMGGAAGLHQPGCSCQPAIHRFIARC